MNWRAVEVAGYQPRLGFILACGHLKRVKFAEHQRLLDGYRTWCGRCCTQQEGGRGWNTLVSLAGILERVS